MGAGAIRSITKSPRHADTYAAADQQAIIAHMHAIAEAVKRGADLEEEMP